MHILISPSEKYVLKDNPQAAVFKCSRSLVLKSGGIKIGALSVCNNYTFFALIKFVLNFYRDKIKKRITEQWNYLKKSNPNKQGNYFIYIKNNGIQNSNSYHTNKELKEESYTTFHYLHLHINPFIRRNRMG